MKKKFFVRLAGIGVLGLLIAGCSSVPQPEIDAAKLAIEKADSLGAGEYLPLEFLAIQDSLNSVLTSVNEADSKFIKNFGSSKEKLAEIANLAAELQTKTTEKKAAVKTEAEAMIVEADTLISSSYLLIAQAPKGKEGTTALTAIRAELDALEVNMIEVNEIMSQGNYMDAQNKVAVIKEKAGAVHAELSSVIEKYKSFRK
jgi:LPS O-antigen subunit length determinant protein (WzzB/FepE family)